MRIPNWWTALAVGLGAVEAAHFDVTVGKGGLKFDPEQITAKVGDTITYSFFARNHSVVESSFQDPCQPIEKGIFSGFVPTPDAEVAAKTTFTIIIDDTKPIWLYCSQTNGNHCQSGMVHSINAPSSGNTHDAYKAKAKDAPTSRSPPDGLPFGGNRVLHVDVGANGALAFTPNNITELPRTTVQFSYNPRNHSVTQSSFEDPCHPLANGFSSGFIPTTASPSGVLFDIVINDTKPIWFYCAQTTGTHCQKGMVGSINAPTSGNTLEAFLDLATKASASTIPPHAPLGGILSVNGTVIPTLNGAVLDATALGENGPPRVPPPGENDPYMMGMAGGGQIANYHWGPAISDNATIALQTLEWLDDLLVHVLWDGFAKLKAGGAWASVYPASIVKAVGAMAAQAHVHRGTATDSLQHYNKPTVASCTYGGLAVGTVDEFLQTVLTLLLLQIGLTLDAIASLAASDPWLVPCLATGLGAKSRMTAVVNMMQNHVAAAAPREVALPAPLVYAYAANRYKPSCGGGDGAELPWAKAAAAPAGLQVTSKNVHGGSGRPVSITVSIDGKTASGQLYVAWLGPWGEIKYTPLSSDGTTSVPAELYGHVWIVVTNADGATKLGEVAKATVAGPEMLWISQP